MHAPGNVAIKMQILTIGVLMVTKPITKGPDDKLIPLANYKRP